MCKFISFFLKNSKKRINHCFLKESRRRCRKTCTVLLTIAMLCGNMLYDMPLKSPAIHAEVTSCCENYSLVNVNGLQACANETGSGHFQLHICSNNFPDENFRNTLENALMRWLGKRFEDGRGDVIQQGEGVIPANITSATCLSNAGISDLTGIEYFANLQKLNCSSNGLTSLNVSHNAELTNLDCHSNGLTSLDVSHNTALTNLECYSNGLTSLDVNINQKLTFLDCHSNDLTSLDVSHNTELTYLDCRSNNLTFLNLDNLKYLSKVPCDGQTTTAQMQYNDRYYVDMNNIIGSGNLARVTITSENWNYDSNKGIAIYNGGDIPSSLNYSYKTNSPSISGLSMPVAIELTYTPAPAPKVTFYNTNGENLQEIVDSNGKVPVPGEPTYTNYKFMGWYTSSDGGKTLSSTPFDFSTTVTADLNLYSKWIVWKEFSNADVIISGNSNFWRPGALDAMHIDLVDENSDNYKNLYSSLTNATDKPITGTKIFDLYFINPDNGERIESLVDYFKNLEELDEIGNENIEIYFKVTDGWNSSNMKAFYVTANNAEAYSMANETINSVPYIHITTNHFSNYAIVNTASPEIASPEIASGAVATGDKILISVCVLIGILLCAGVMFFLLKKKK